MFNIIILGIVSLLTDVSTEMVYPLLPLFLTTRLGASPAIVGLIEGIAESLASLLKVFSGYVSDRFGRRKPLAILGYGSSTIGKIVLYLAGSWPMVLLARIIDRFGKGVRTAPRDALIADSSDPSTRGRAYGLHRALDTLGAALGVLLAYYFMTAYKGDFSKVFLWAMVPATLGVCALFFAREAREEREAGKAREALAERGPEQVGGWINWSKLDRRLKGFLVVVFLFALGNSSNQFLLLRARNLGFNPASVLLIYFAYNVAYSLLSYPAGRLSDKIGRKSLLVAGYAMYGLVYVGFALASARWHIWALFVAYGFYIALTEGVEKALVADIAPGELRATTIGLHATLVGIGLLPASLLAGLLWNVFGPQATFYFGGLMGLLAAVGIWIVV
ncbi:MAG: MFS transporter [Firmicutes bacterium]|nr:MFS transporter [Bacillota bacterium]